MNLVKKSQTNKFAACQSTTIFEYLMKDPEISGAVAKINGRYPETGFSLNEKSKELDITHYFDDQQTILNKLVSVENKFLFDSLGVFKNSGYARVKSWKEIAKLI